MKTMKKLHVFKNCLSSFEVRKLRLELEGLLGDNIRKGKRNRIMFQSFIFSISGQILGT